MNSRERIQATLSHKIPDILPIDFGAHRSSGISAIAYNRLKRYLGYSEETTKLYDVMQQLAIPEPMIVDRFGGDVYQVIQFQPAFGVKADRWKCDFLPDGSPCMVPYDFNPVVNAKGDFEIIDPELGVVARRPKTGIYFDNARYYLKAVEDMDDLKKMLVVPTVTDAELDYLEVQAKELYYNTDKALLLHVGCAVYEQGQQDFGFENFYYLLAAEPEMVHYYEEKMTDAYCVMLGKILDRVGKYIDLAWFGGDDLGTQETTQMSVKMYREMLKPYHSKIYQFVQKKNPTVKVGLHSCGAIKALIPDLIEAGVQALNPVQISAKGMDPVELKRTFGKDIVFWGGGADMQGFVSRTDDPREIYKHTRNLIEIFAQDGNFVFNQVHNILADVAPEKILAIYQAALDFRKEQL